MREGLAQHGSEVAGLPEFQGAHHAAVHAPVRAQRHEVRDRLDTQGTVGLDAGVQMGAAGGAQSGGAAQLPAAAGAGTG
ncbi:hypothetical protein GCM10008961_28040 [Deinococcus knuensis]|uniref:Uncharacterized protein n=1 Tax=Deinococcus knuensis TaxID=1837380 RepID=A0ABQ2SMY0_9DEIO|nr:hypothetical protein GCM10008961_28040 [Deinococcus knuensis]